MGQALDYSLIRTTLGALFSSITGLVAMDREGPQNWGGSLRQAVPLPAHGLLHLVTGRIIGHDETHYIYDEEADPGEELTPWQQGLRSLIWEVRVESQSVNAVEDATYYLERLRTLIRGPTARDAFHTAGLGLDEIGPIVDLSAVLGERMTSIAQVDFTLTARAAIADTATTFIETIDVESAWEDPAGNALPDALQTIGELP